MKLVAIIGARPQFIKAAAVSREIGKHPEIKELIVHSGQHFDINMNEIFFQDLHIPKPDYFLGINSLSHGAMTGQMIEKIEEILIKEKPDYAMVYGDTNTTLAGALAAKKLHIKVAHVEAGLRSFNMAMPEEVNRILTDRISNVLFCPTDHAVKNLRKEGFDNFDCKIDKCGDVMQDAAIYYSGFAKRPEGLDIDKNFALVTIHREENTNDIDRFENIFSGLSEISKNISIILPMHPRTRKYINDKIEKIIGNKSFHIIEPVGYLQMIWLLKNCEIVITDSGGLQKEAFFFEKPCLTLRDETEWIELIENGYNAIVGANKVNIINGYINLNKTKVDFQNNDLYGGGKAAKRILEFFQK